MLELNAPVPVVPQPLQQEPTLPCTDAGAVMQRLLQRITANERQLVTLRCDELPEVAVPEADLSLLFSSLLRLILEKKAGLSRLYLHISCRKVQTGRAGGTTLHQIQFATNLFGMNPVDEYSRRMSRFGSVLSQCNGSFAISQEQRQGCVFLFSLPGKTPELYGVE